MSDSPGLPEAPPPAGAYSPATVYGGLAFSAGMTPRRAGRLTVTGTVGSTVDVEAAREAAGVAAENALAALAAAAGGLDRLDRCLKMTVFVACVDGFTEQTTVANGASDAVARHLGGPPAARSAVGVRALPSGAPVEVELVVALRDPAGE